MPLHPQLVAAQERLLAQGFTPVAEPPAAFSAVAALCSPDWRSLGTTLGANLVFGFFLGADQLAHAGGLLGGILAAFIAGAAGRRTPWRRWATYAVALAALLLVAGVIPVPHLGWF